MKKLREGTLWFITTTSIVMVVMVCVVLYNQRVVLDNQRELMLRQEQEIAELNQTIGEYRINEEWFEDYIDLLEDIYEGKINEAVLEERVKQLENVKNEKPPQYIYDDYVNQIIDDLDDAIEITIYYYENTDQVVDLVTFIATNYPALYERLLSYT